MRVQTIVLDLWDLEAILTVIGKEGEQWDYYETDPDWWAVRLWTRRN